jgi:hypothetical protein
MNIDVENAVKSLKKFKNWMRGEIRWRALVVEKGSLKDSFLVSLPQREQRLPLLVPLRGVHQDFLELNSYR